MEHAEYDALCKDIISTCLKMNALGINQGTSGNVSAKIDTTRFAITPSGCAYETLEPKDIVIVEIKPRGDDRSPGFYGLPDRQPSSEWRIHHDIYREYAEAKAIVHTHSAFCTALSACQGITKIPPFHYMVAAAGGSDIHVAKYATFGTQALSDNVILALRERKACLMGNHGQIAYGESCAKALWLANEVECLAKQYVYLMSTNQPMAELSAEEMSRVLEKFKTYGKKGNSSSGALQLLGTPSSALSKRKRNPEEDHASETLQEGD